MSPHRLLIFVKAPRPGYVKTRLGAAIGNEAACAAHCRLAETLFAGLAPLKNVELRFAPDDAGPEMQRWLRPGWSARPQGEGDLGVRLSRAFAETFASDSGAKRVVIVGSDCPWVQVSDIEAAWEQLGQHELVLGPAEDGGYWLVGLRQCRPELFENIHWSSDTVLAQTLSAARSVGVSVHLLRRLTDVDTEEDWRRFLAGSVGEVPKGR